MEIKKMSGRLAIRIVRLRFWALVVLGVAGLFPSMVMAQQGCIVTPIVKTFESCDGPVGTPNRRCEYRNVIDYYAFVCPPPQAPTPPVPPSSPPPSSPPPIKTADEIEREQHVKFCKETPSRVGAAVNQCKGNAQGYHNYFVANKCSAVQSSEWTFKITLNNMIDVGYSQTISPGPTCRQDAAFALAATTERCDSDAGKYLAALALQCSDVK